MSLRFSAFAASDPGKKRTNNEDAFLVDDELRFFAVADGMGGASSGEIASATTLKTIREFLTRSTPLLNQLAAAPTEDLRAGAAAALEKAVQEASQVVFDMARADPKKNGMGTTVAAVLQAGSHALIASVGDSRVYLIRRGHTHRLTEDHTVLANMLKEGRVTREEMKGSPLGSVLVRSVGPQSWVQVDMLTCECTAGDRLLICSDGLHGYLDDEHIAAMVEGDPENLPAKLIAHANEAGGKDNITAIILDVTGTSESRVDAELPIEAMSAAPLFHHLSYKEKSSILAIAISEEYPPDTNIVTEGDFGDDIYVVIRGDAAVLKQGIVIAHLGPGGHFGEMGLFDHVPRSATVRTTTTCVVLVIRRMGLMAVMRKEPTIGVKLLWGLIGTLSARLRATNSDVVVLRQELALSKRALDVPFEPNSASSPPPKSSRAPSRMPPPPGAPSVPTPPSSKSSKNGPTSPHVESTTTPPVPPTTPRPPAPSAPRFDVTLKSSRPPAPKKLPSAVANRAASAMPRSHVVCPASRCCSFCTSCLRRVRNHRAHKTANPR